MKKNTFRFRKKIFKKTKKPIEYIHIDNPKTNQEYRQLHFNLWSKYHKVYSGSYLPNDPELLEKRGWVKIVTIGGVNKAIYERKSTKQQVLFEGKGKDVDVNHYHWFIGHHKDKINHHQLFNRKKEYCKKGSEESHILPFDKEYKKKEIKMKLNNKHLS